MKKNRMFGAVIFAAAVFSIPSVGDAASFSDVSEGFWAEDEINYLADKHVMNGYENGAFGVNDEITRSQAARTLTRIHDLDTADPDVSFNDVDETGSAYPAIAAAVEAGFFADAEAFHPNDSLTRAQMAAILTRAYDLEGEQSADYRDVPRDYWAYQEISMLGAHRLTTGYEDLTFHPSDNVTRAQFGVFLSRAEDESFRAPYAVLPQKETENVYYPEVTGLDDEAAQSINQTFEQQAEKAAEHRQEVMELSEQEPNEEIADAYEFQETYRVEQDSEDYLSVVFESYEFTGGAHGMSHDTAYTFHPEKGQELELQDLFAEETDYESIFNEKIRSGAPDSGETFEMVVDFEGVDPDTDQFYVNEEGPAVYFQPYEIGPYAAGIPSYTVSWDAFDTEQGNEGDRPETRNFTVEIEGMEEEDTFKLMDEAGMPFTTYIPEHFETENTSSGAADGVLVSAAFTEDTEPTEEPVWKFINPSYGKEDGVTLDKMVQEVRDYAELEEVNLDVVNENDNPDFGEYEIRFENEEGQTYWITILEQDGTFMEWHREYPVELEEGIGPRAEILKDQWEWRE
ncbi:S-layer homology domain-containing protein [Salibacterium sp. K-3]